jgi:hypothetical protein
METGHACPLHSWPCTRPCRAGAPAWPRAGYGRRRRQLEALGSRSSSTLDHVVPCSSPLPSALPYLVGPQPRMAGASSAQAAAGEAMAGGASSARGSHGRRGRAQPGPHPKHGESTGMHGFNVALHATRYTVGHPSFCE